MKPPVLDGGGFRRRRPWLQSVRLFFVLALMSSVCISFRPNLSPEAMATGHGHSPCSGGITFYHDLAPLDQRRDCFIVIVLARYSFLWQATIFYLFTEFNSDEEHRLQVKPSFSIRSGTCIACSSWLTNKLLRKLSDPDRAQPNDPDIVHRKTFSVLRRALNLSGCSHEQLSGSVISQIHRGLMLPPTTDSTAIKRQRASEPSSEIISRPSLEDCNQRNMLSPDLDFPTDDPPLRTHRRCQVNRGAA